METQQPASPRPQHAPARAIWLVLAGIVSVQLGSVIGKGAFDSVAPTALTWLRLAASVLILLVWARPRISGHDRADWAFAVSFGTSLALMNWSIYQSFSRIPIGVAVTVEFLGPLTVALIGSRRPRDVLWVLLAGLGVALLGGSRAGLDLVGVGFALLAGASWAAYILLSAQTGRRWPGVDGLTIASLVALAWLTPGALVTGGDALLDPRVLAVGAIVGLLSSALPYGLEIHALRSLSPALFGILMSLEPAAAALAAALILGELLTGVQLVAMAFVMVASTGAAWTSSSAKSGSIASAGQSIPGDTPGDVSEGISGRGSRGFWGGISGG